LFVIRFQSFRSKKFAMGSSQSTEKKSPVKESAVTESPVKESSETAIESTAKESSATKNKSSVEKSSNSSPKADEIIVTPKLEKEDKPEANLNLNLAGLTITTPTKAPDAADEEPDSPKPEFKATEEDLALVEAVSKTLRESTGGKSLEIVLSPAVKKPKSRVSPPTSPSSNQVTIAKKLQDAEERKQVLEQEKLQKLTAKLGKIPNVQEMKEKKIAEKSEMAKEKLESKLNNAEENKKKHIEEVKDKVSEHTAKIEKAQLALEAAIEAAKEATKAGLDEKMSKNEEKKNEQLREMMNALTEHSERIKNVRNNMEEKMKPKAQQILENMSKKEEAARDLLAKQEAERKFKVEESKKKAEMVRMNKEKLAAETSLTTESA